MTLDIKTSDVAIVIATVLGPVLAVQAQKFIERTRESRSRKLKVFERLMATRMARLSPDHVEALNMIDLVFQGKTKFLFKWKSRRERLVLSAWRLYLDHLSNGNATSPDWGPKRDSLFNDLLSTMAEEARFEFDRILLMRGAYSPLAHEEIEQEQKQVRRLLVQVLGGSSVIKTAVVNQSTLGVSSIQDVRHIQTLDGLWTASFTSSLGISGAGVVVFQGGKILGGDQQYFYKGDFWLVDDQFSGNLKVSRYGDMASSVFGPLDNFSITISGRPSENVFSLRGFLVERADATIEFSLTRQA